METIKIEVREEGINELSGIRDQLSQFVLENFDTLFEGAIRSMIRGIEYVDPIKRDDYAPRRVQINATRLHKYQGLKYACGHKYNNPIPPTEEQLLATIRDIQFLLDEAAKPLLCGFKINIIET